MKQNKRVSIPVLIFSLVIVIILFFPFPGILTNTAFAQDLPTEIPTLEPLPSEEPPQNDQGNIITEEDLEAIPYCPTTIGFGKTIQCSISKAGEVDKYTITVNAGDKVLVRMAKTSGTFWPKVSVYNSSGSKICEKTASSLAEISTCTLAVAGKYTIRAADGYNGKYTGKYYLFLQRLNNPGSTVSVTFGSTRSASIIAPTEMDSYIFTASAGDKVLVRMTNTSSEPLEPDIRIYSPTGLKLCSASKYIMTEISACSLPIAGQYTLLAGDGYDGKSLGTYNLYLQKLKKPINPISISFGNTRSGSIIKAAQMITYSFYANAADSVLLRVINTSGDLQPGVRIYSPVGKKVCEDSDYSLAEIESCSLPANGKYTVLVFDSNYGTKTGNYEVHLQRLNKPGDATAIAFGQTISGSVLLPVDMKAYTFAATSGDKVIVRMTKSSGEIWPGIRVYSPTGQRLCDNYGATTAEVGSCTLSANGTYTVLTYDYLDGSKTGDYYVHVQRLNNPGNATSISFGETLSNTISYPSQADAYTFTATAGDKVLVRGSKSSGEIWPSIRVYGPSGAKLCDDYGSTTAEIESCTLSATGTYTVLTYDYLDGSKTGDYYVHVQRLNNPGNATSISFGGTLSDTISYPSQADAYTFTATAGDKLLVRVSKSSGEIWPGIRVYGPSGANLCDDYGSTTAEIESCTLSATGTYTVLTYDYLDGSKTGDYYVHVQRLNNPGNATSISFGGTLSDTISYPSQADAYTFTATSGDKVLVRGSKSSGEIWPGIRVYGPSGAKLCDDYGSTTAEIESCTLSATGTYTVLTYDYLDGTKLGDYSIYIQRLNNPGNSSGISIGETLIGSISSAAEMDTFSFSISSSTSVTLKATRTSGTLWPGIRIYSPIGTLLCSNYGSSSAEITSCSLSSAGTYSILVYDYLDGTKFGDYSLYLH